jgi:RND family efflux transporter MFP subunit
MNKMLDHLPTPFSDIPTPPPAAPGSRRWLWVVAGLVVLCAAGAGVSQLRSESAAQPPAPSTGTDAPAAKAKTVRPVRQTIRKSIEQPGRVEGYEQTPLYVKIPGFAKMPGSDTVWKADIGQRVAAGEVLAELSVPEEREELKRREAAADLARAQVTAAETALDAARAEEIRSDALVAQARAAKARADANVFHWSSEFKRIAEAHKNGVASGSDYDTTQDQLKTAEAAIKETDAGIAAAVAGKASATAARVRAEANVTVAKANQGVAEADARRQVEWLKYATVSAPFAGVVAQRNVDRGQYVMPPTSGSTQPPLFVVVRTDPVRVFVDVSETEAALITENMPAGVRIQAQSDREIPGKVTRFSWALDNNTRTLRVQIDLPNPDGLLRPGMFASARFVTERPDVWVVPAGTVSTAEEQPFAVRLEGGKGLKTPVKLGARQNGMVELMQKQTRPVAKGEPIVWEPLTGTEVFLTTRPSGWTDGAPVELVK